MARGHSHKAIPQAASSANLGAGRIHRHHETNITRDDSIQITLKQHVHIRIHPTLDEQNTVAKQVCFEGAGEHCIVCFSHFRWKMSAKESCRLLIGPEIISPTTPFPGFDKTRHVGIFFFRHRLEPSLMNDPGDEPITVLPDGRRINHILFDDVLLRRSNLAQNFAVTATLLGTCLAIVALSISYALEARVAGFRRGKAVILQ
mmetsp:Transcript_10107/g.28367  ORF Transcript_10107/g.28367 Transcript_10107/m.28367 type:complete len:203 (+) Transcript_10107:697-1305(+)